jgi:hypothetical protein
VNMSRNSSSSSLFDFSFGTGDGQPLMFRYMENQSWRKLRRVLGRKNAPELCKERDDSGLTLVGMALGFEAPLDIIKNILTKDPSQADATDFYGATPLHVACLNGASLEAVEFLLGNYNHLATTMDKDNRVPLHHAVECLCRNEIEYSEGTKVIEALTRVDPNAIYAADKHSDTPIDLVQLARMEVNAESKEYKRLTKLYLFLTSICTKMYVENRKMWEENGYAPTKKKNGDDKSRNTKSTTQSSVSNASSWSDQMDVSVACVEVPDTMGESSSHSMRISDDCDQGNRRRFWKK